MNNTCGSYLTRVSIKNKKSVEKIMNGMQDISDVQYLVVKGKN